MKGSEKEQTYGATRGDFVEIESGAGSRALPAVRLDGPYGAPAEDVFDCEVAVLIGAGIGECCSHGNAKSSRADCVTSRCHSVRLDPQAYLVSPETRQPRHPPPSRVLLGLPRCPLVWLVPKSASGGRGCPGRS